MAQFLNKMVCKALGNLELRPTKNFIIGRLIEIINQNPLEDENFFQIFEITENLIQISIDLINLVMKKAGKVKATYMTKVDLESIQNILKSKF